jgi:type II secretory pathway component PulC
MLTAAEQLYNSFHETFLTSVSKWEKTTAAKKQQIQDARQTHKRAMKAPNNNILILEKEISGLRALETAAQVEAEKQANALAEATQEVDLGRRTRQELERDQAAIAQNVGMLQEKVKQRQNGL